MKKPTVGQIRKAQRKIDNTLEAGMRRARQRQQRTQKKQAAKTQRAKYNSGAAQSPTLPPRPNFERDRKTLAVMGFVEAEATDPEGRVLVDVLAQKFLFEQYQLDALLAKVALKTDDDLLRELEHLISYPNPERQAFIEHRMRHRWKIANDGVRIYGWDKCTHLLRSCFISLAMNPALTVPFTVNLSEKAIEGAKRSKVGFSAHLQDRLRKTLSRKLDGHVPDFWFTAEKGTKYGFHLHGAIACGNDPDVQRSVTAALLSFSGLKSAKSVKLSAAGPRFRWSQYCSKHSALTQRLLSAHTFSCTLRCRRQGKEMYEAFRSEIKAWTKV